MNSSVSQYVAQICRWVIGLSWIYHGLLPKVWHIAPMEYTLTSKALSLVPISVLRSSLSTLNFTDEAIVHLVIVVAGGIEIAFGIMFLLLYANRIINYLNVLGLIVLFFMVLVVAPRFLIEAFNPVTTTLPLISMSVILLKLNSIKEQQY